MGLRYAGIPPHAYPRVLNCVVLKRGEGMDVDHGVQAQAFRPEIVLLDLGMPTWASSRSFSDGDLWHAALAPCA
jgi:hypothetical protein